MSPAQCCRLIKHVFIAVPRTRDGVAYSRVSIYLNEWRASGDIEARRVREAKARWRCVVQMFIEQELVSQVGETEHTNHRVREHVSVLRNKVLRSLLNSDGEPWD